MRPFSTLLDPAAGVLHGASRRTVRRLSDLRGCYRDAATLEGLIREDDRVVYEYAEAEVAEEPGQLRWGTTVIYPGKVGDEYHMTKGHRHAWTEASEVYLGLRGFGWVLVESPQGESAVVELRPGQVAYVPPGWAHRTVNVGNTPLVFFAVYPATAGHDYASVAARGFAKRVVERHGQPTLVDRDEGGPAAPRG